MPAQGRTSTAEAKAALRRRMLETRAAMDAHALAESGRRLRDVLVATPQIAQARCVAAYVSVGREPGTGALIETLTDRGVEILLPIVLPDLDLDWARYTGPGDLRTATRGLLEPLAPALGIDAILATDAVVAPALAVDRLGTRLGRGGGCYDRVLARLAGRETFTCALLHDGELLDIRLPRDPHDVPVKAAAAPSGLHRLR